VKAHSYLCELYIFVQFAGPMYTGNMKANAVGKKCTEVDCAYLAGLIDGDGAIHGYYRTAQ
jgi:hypothetical protein